MVTLISTSSAPNDTSTSALEVSAYRMPIESLEKPLNISHLDLQSRFTRSNRRPCLARSRDARMNQHALRHCADRHHFVYAAQRDGLARHAEHHAARLVLGERAGAGPFHAQQAARSILAHAGEQHADSARAQRLRRR